MRIFAERHPIVALTALAFVVLNNGLASLMFIAVYGFDLASFADPGSLVDRGAGVADTLRLAAVIDMVGYLAFAPVVLYLRGRLGAVASERAPRSVLLDVLAFCGLGFVLVGSIGAVLMASAGPALLQTARESPETAAAARITFGALANAVYVGLWGTLELVLYGIWFVAVSWFVRGEGRAFAALGFTAGVGALTYAARTGTTGSTPAQLSGPLDAVIFGAVGLGIVWAFWLAVRLWRGA